MNKEERAKYYLDHRKRTIDGTMIGGVLGDVLQIILYPIIMVLFGVFVFVFYRIVGNFFLGFILGLVAFLVITVPLMLVGSKIQEKIASRFYDKIAEQNRKIEKENAVLYDLTLGQNKRDEIHELEEEVSEALGLEIKVKE